MPINNAGFSNGMQFERPGQAKPEVDPANKFDDADDFYNAFNKDGKKSVNIDDINDDDFFDYDNDHDSPSSEEIAVGQEIAREEAVEEAKKAVRRSGQKKTEKKKPEAQHTSKRLDGTKRKTRPIEDIKDIPRSVVSAMRSVFPDANNKVDLISAFVYVFTGGKCELTEGAKDLVANYEPDDKLGELMEHMTHMEQLMREQRVYLQSIELCACYDLYDRRFGARERRGQPKDNEFREQGNIDLLKKLRRQARDQREQDMRDRGRDIYNSIKDRNDPKK